MKIIHEFDGHERIIILRWEIKLYRVNGRWGFWKRIKPHGTCGTALQLVRVENAFLDKGDFYRFIPWYKFWQLTKQYKP